MQAVSWIARVFAAVVWVAVSGCATDPARLPIGSTRAQALQQLGKPSATYPLPGGGERLQYSREPAGYQVDNVDLDAAGRVVAGSFHAGLSALQQSNPDRKME